MVPDDYEDDLFKKLKLKHHRRPQSHTSNDEQIDVSNSDCSTRSSMSDMELEPYFEDYYRTPNPPRSSQMSSYSNHLLTPDIDELQRKEHQLVQSLHQAHQEVDCTRKSFEID